MPPALQAQTEIITLEQYEALPENTRVEVFENVVYDMASPSQIHQSLSMQLSTVINSYILRKKEDCNIFHAPFDVKLSDHPLIIVQPDIMIVCVNYFEDNIVSVQYPFDSTIKVNIYDDLYINFPDIAALLNI